MATKWTEKQLTAIESRRRNLLVSAAAGSGKTAVLVERIIRMITEGEKPLHIDQLLVMTFTKAAADEMRERILKAVDDKLAENPENVHLQMQAAMIPYAKITTIDSFCLEIIRENYNKLNIDPAFRVGDEGEMVLMRNDVMKAMLEDYYEKGEERFSNFVETYATGKSDYGIEDYILQVYTFAQSNPWPDAWFAACRKEAETCEKETLEELPWMRNLKEDVRLTAEELAVMMEGALAVCGEEDGPAPYTVMIAEDLRQLRKLGEAEDYETINRLLAGFTFGRLAAARSKAINPEKKAYVTGCRDIAKKTVGKLKDLYGFESEEEVLNDILGTKESVSMLLELAMEYSRRFQEKKREKNVVDFNDLEHYALEILLVDESGKEDGGTAVRDGGENERKKTPSPVADELSRQYEEILVDEYQDSNEVQEALIQSISRERFGSPNVFMVGDVKQSIYKFRLARPELFLHKYETYPEEEGAYQKVELRQNFRSRAMVLAGINDVFYQIMTKKLGNIRYTQDAALHPGAQFPPNPGSGRVEEQSELLMVHMDMAQLSQLDEEKADYTSREMEAKLIANAIRNMTDPETGLLIWDKELEKYRTARYGDMVILLRSQSGWAEEFVNILMNEGIPAYAQQKTGYFLTVEVETVLSFLSVIDNPMQDIPLAAVMKSPIAGILDEELAHMTAVFKKTVKKGQDRGIYAAWKSYLERVEEEEKDPSGVETDGQEPVFAGLAGKLGRFYELLTQYRRKAVYLPIHELLYDIYETTGYYDYVSAMPAGEVRRANLDMLVEKAVAYEKTSYTGLFHFIRYIGNLKKYDTDYGEASPAGSVDTVRIMTIHKSKGLEFPVVFLAGMGKKFNKQDLYKKLLIDPDLGIGTDFLDLEHRVRASTLKKNVLRRKMELESLGEELRVLYVAMTRAKEKLVMTAVDKHLDKKLERYHDLPRADGQIPFTILASAESMLDWLLMSLAGRAGGDSSEPSSMPLNVRAVVARTKTMAAFRFDVSDLVGTELERQAEKRLSKEELLSLDLGQTFDEACAKALEEAFSYRYPHEAEIGLHTKVSVSELKQQGQFLDDEESDFLPTIPVFMREAAMEEREGDEVRIRPAAGRSAAYRGTAYHRALELLDFSAVHTEQEVREALKRLTAEKRMDEESAALVNHRVIWRFLTSPLGKRMARAQEEGRLRREQQFVIGIPAREMDMADSDELVLIQGIIDAFFEEDGNLILADYKTDYVKEGQEDVLVERYRLQLQYYQRALEQMTERKVAEKVIYSLTLHKEIRID